MALVDDTAMVINGGGLPGLVVPCHHRSSLMRRPKITPSCLVGSGKKCGKNKTGRKGKF